VWEEQKASLGGHRNVRLLDSFSRSFHCSSSIVLSQLPFVMTSQLASSPGKENNHPPKLLVKSFVFAPSLPALGRGASVGSSLSALALDSLASWRY
jgi:hypothetical protein